MFDLFPRDALDRLLTEARLPWLVAQAKPSPSPLVQPGAPPPAAVGLTAADWPIPDGRFFTQTNGRPTLTSATGFAVSNTAGLAFFDEFQRLGGVDAVGYPL